LAREKQPELGIRNPYDARYRITVGPCRGLDQATDPSTVSDEALTKLINGRVYDGIVVCRGGQSAAKNSTPLSGCVQGMIDVDGSGPRIVLAMDRDEGLGPVPGIDLFDQGINPSYVADIDLPVVPYPGQLFGSAANDDNPRYALLWWNEQIVYGGSDDYLYRFIFPDDDLSATSVQAERLFKLEPTGSGTPFEISSMCTMPDTNSNGSAPHNPKMGPPLYFGSIGGGVYAYVNGELATLLADGTFTNRVLVFQYNNRLYAASRQELRVQSGWLDGGSPTSTTWAAVTMPGGVTNFIPMCAIECYGFGYIGGGDSGATPTGRILKIDDSTGTPVLTLANAGVVGADDLESADDFAFAFGQAYVAYRARSGVNKISQIGTMDNNAAITMVAGTWSEDGMVTRIVGTYGMVYAVAWGSGFPTGGSNQALYSLDDVNTLTKLADIADVDPGQELSPYDMVIF
jgi:hypothetical protein